MLETQVTAIRNRFSHLIDRCRSMKELKMIHTQILVSPTLQRCDKYMLITRLLFFCAFSDSGSLGYAADVFRAIENPNLYIYNIMIRACASGSIDGGGRSNSDWPLMLYKQMLSHGVAPDHLTFPFLVKECTKRVDRGTGRGVHAQVLKFGLYNDTFIQNSLITFYSACGFQSGAQEVFDGMLNRDVASWNSLITGYLRKGNLDAALGLFRKMTKKNIITWNTMITGFVQGGRPKVALDLFHEMQIQSDEMVRPDKVTIASALSACSHLGAIDHGKWVHDYLRRSDLASDIVIGTALVDMYGKCGCVERAYKVLREMPEKDTLTWTAMISAFAQNGHGEEAFDLFDEMKMSGEKPNEVTFVGLLSACSHSGLVEKGRQCFEMMKSVYSLEPQVYHYACMVDILCRAGLLEEAEKLIRSLPMEPDVFVWGALLGGCQMHGNMELGERISQHLIDLEPWNHAYYVSLCDIYAKAGRFNKLNRIRNLMTERGIRKEVPGCSMIEMDGIVYEFLVNGPPDVKIEMEKIQWILSGLTEIMKMKWDKLYHEEHAVEV